MAHVQRMSFLDLVEDIRLLIYAELLTSDKVVELRASDRKSMYRWNHEKSSATHPQILRSCSQIHSEALKVLYSTNRFRLQVSVSKLLRHVGPGGKFVRHVELLSVRYYYPRYRITDDEQLLQDFEHICSMADVRFVRLVVDAFDVYRPTWHDDSYESVVETRVKKWVPNAEVGIVVTGYWEPGDAEEFVERHRSIGWVVDEQYEVIEG